MLVGKPLNVEWAGGLRNVRGRLRMGGDRGTEIHAASFVRERRIVLDRSLRRNPGELRRILVHELFHFAWIRLSNADRQAWKHLLLAERERQARGELGWSAEIRKSALPPGRTVTVGRGWNEYCCESFCDSAAWLYGQAEEHEEFTLARRFCQLRRVWFRHLESRRDGVLRI